MPFAVVTSGGFDITSIPTIDLTDSGMYEPPCTWTRSCLHAPIAALTGGIFGQAVSDEISAAFYDAAARSDDRRRYQDTAADMADLSTRFMGVSADRCRETIKISNGLKPGTLQRVRANRFPQATMRKGKIPKVSKGIVRNLHQAAVAEVVFCDTFETSDTQFRYGQAFVGYRSRYGQVYPLQSRKLIGRSFRRFCSEVFKPLILIRDNIAENVGGELAEVCLELMVKSAFSCPCTPEPSSS